MLHALDEPLRQQSGQHQRYAARFHVSHGGKRRRVHRTRFDEGCDEAPFRAGHAQLAFAIAWSKANPGKLNYASPGPGIVHHLATEILKQSAGIDMVHVPYRTAIYAPLLAKDVDAMFETMPGPLPHLASGRIRALAVTGPHRLAALPDVRTFAEQGVLDPDVSSWWGFVGPAGLPPAIVTQLNTAIRAVLMDPEFADTLAKWSVESRPGTADTFAAYIAQEAAHWKHAVKQLGIALE
jgi:tripartite-type tricarboxylate transporter receptor subunit TctC